MALALASIAAFAGTSCDVSCEGGSWQEAHNVQCMSAGDVVITPPTRFGPPAPVAVTHGVTCGNGTKSRLANPEVTLLTQDRTDYVFGVTLELPVEVERFTYTFPLPADAPNRLIRPSFFLPYTATMSSIPFEIDIVGGTLAIESSTPEELLLSLDLQIALASTGETMSLTGHVTVNDCSVERSRVCVGGD